MRAAALLAIAGCGRLGFAAATDGGEPSAVEILPGATTLLPLTTMHLDATVPVTWSIDEAGADAITATGDFSAGMTTGVVHVRATAGADSAAVAIAITDAPIRVVMADTGSVTSATGMAHQERLLYAPELGAWWLFTISSVVPDSLITRTSRDFVTWSDGPTLALGHTHGQDGRNITLADRVIGGTHVVHLSVGYVDAVRGRLHVKATLDATGLVFGAPVATNSGGTTDPDGPAVAITGQGSVIDGSGWDQTPATPPLSPCGDGDVEVFTSATVDTGATSFDAMAFARRVLWCVPNRVDARYLYADGETLYHLYEDGNSEPDAVNILYSIRRPDSAWLPDESAVKTTPPSVFATDTAFPIDDWTVRPVGRTLHAIRRVGTAYEHRQLALGSDGPWTAGAAIPDSAAAGGSGVYAAAYGTGMILVEITSSNGLAYTFWDGTAWTAWRPLAVPSTMLTALAGSTPRDGERPAIMWQEPGEIAGAWLP